MLGGLTGLLLVSVLMVAAALTASEAQAPDGEPSPGPMSLALTSRQVGFEFPTAEVAVAGATVVTEDDQRVELVRRLLGHRPLAAHAALMVATADEHGIDWRLMPVISILESSGGAAACRGNAWGYANCNVTFATFEEGIGIVAATLAAPPYTGRSTAVMLCIWVSGNFCTTHHAVNYVYRASGLYSRLGGAFALPAWIAAETGEQPQAADAVAAEPPPPLPTPEGEPLEAAVPAEPTTDPTVAPSEPEAQPTEPEPTPTATSSPEATAVPDATPSAPPEPPSPSTQGGD